MKTKKFFHQKRPWLDRILHYGETEREQECRHLQLENPEAYRKMMERQEEQMAGIRRSGSVGIC